MAAILRVVAHAAERLEKIVSCNERVPCPEHTGADAAVAAAEPRSAFARQPDVVAARIFFKARPFARRSSSFCTGVGHDCSPGAWTQCISAIDAGRKSVSVERAGLHHSGSMSHIGRAAPACETGHE
jgi:hypothetical protein